MLLEKSKKEGELLKEEASLTFYFVNLRTSIAFLNLSVAGLQEKSLEKQKEINKKIEELNQLREKLKQENQDWEEIKKKIVSFQNYEGILKNAICKNSEHKYISDSREETVNCEDFSKNLFQK
ncbi:hypothetical protein MSUIS_06070 [Mycoplasma suis KI3806]|uniref:Uncharacterized protein n=1 Tax=Mycoplasma suis (strain KI_3806) TaxID=708248 RepID=F0V219_MYCS3|nr:hypothetical protein [Mycoplasma suis]CBZ40700.1 hypothetical protein MSUIS_06070 [Mycoplasma suis KI3806]